MLAADLGRNEVTSEVSVEDSRTLTEYCTGVSPPNFSLSVGHALMSTRYFYKPNPMRTHEEIRRENVATNRETEGLTLSVIAAGVAIGR